MIIYEIGKYVYPDDYDTSDEICSNGIHCFQDRLMAAAYCGG
jgi:hypothetical protein